MFLYIITVLNYLLTKKVKNREYLPYILKWKKLNGIGAEIGTWQGYYSEKILERSSLFILFSIDAWQPYIYMPEAKKQEINYALTEKRLAKFKERSYIIKSISEKASRMFPDKHFDFIYLDGNHEYESIKKDIELWWPKMKEKGIFAGHDYTPFWSGVIKAVDEFITENNLKLNIISEKGKTWWVEKEL